MPRRAAVDSIGVDSETEAKYSKWQIEISINLQLHLSPQS